MIFRLFSPNLRNFFARLPCAPRRGKLLARAYVRLHACSSAQMRKKGKSLLRTEKQMKICACAEAFERLFVARRAALCYNVYYQIKRGSLCY